MAQVSVRGKILDAGFRVLYAKGFNGCSIQDITDHAGVPKGSFYNHFQSKEALALEAIERYVSVAGFAMLDDGSKPPLERLREHFKHMAKLYKTHGTELGCMAGNLSSEMAASSPVLRADLVMRFTRWNTQVTELIRQAQAAGEASTDRSAEPMGRFIVASWQGCVQAMRLHGSMRPLDDFFELAFALLLPSTTDAAPAAKPASTSKKPVRAAKPKAG